MILEHPYYFYPEAVAPDVCDQILRVGMRAPATKAVTEDEEGQDEGAVAFLADQWLFDMLIPYVTTANREASWNFQIERYEALQFGTYRQGQHYGWHADQWLAPYRKSDGQAPNPLTGLIRKISLIVQLTDPKRYDGGDLEIEIPAEPGQRRIATGEELQGRGTVIVFPSFVYHQLLPLEKGRRQSLVAWSCGQPYV